MWWRCYQSSARTDGLRDRATEEVSGQLYIVYTVYCIVKSSVLYQLTYQWVLVEKEIYP